MIRVSAQIIPAMMKILAYAYVLATIAWLIVDNLGQLIGG